MDIAYLHVVTNHLPIFGVPLALLVLALGLWTRDQAVQRTALLLFVLLGVGTGFVYATGHGAEDFIEDVRRNARDAIGPHEDAAAFAFASVALLAVASLVLFVLGGGLDMLRRRATTRTIPRAGAVLVLLTAALATAVLGYTGRLGGKIAHTEFGSATSTQLEERKDDGDKGRGRRRRGRDDGRD